MAGARLARSRQSARLARSCPGDPNAVAGTARALGLRRPRRCSCIHCVSCTDPNQTHGKQAKAGGGFLLCKVASRHLGHAQLVACASGGPARQSPTSSRPRKDIGQTAVVSAVRAFLFTLPVQLRYPPFLVLPQGPVSRPINKCHLYTAQAAQLYSTTLHDPPWNPSWSSKSDESCRPR